LPALPEIFMTLALLYLGALCSVVVIEPSYLVAYNILNFYDIMYSSALLLHCWWFQ